MKRLKLFIASLSIAVVGTVALVPATTTYAAENPLDQICNGAASNDSEVCANKNQDANALIKTLINTLLYIIGALSVVMIIFAGISYTTSAGDAGKVTRAKNTLLYAIVGLVIAFLAYAIVNWVLGIF